MIKSDYPFIVEFARCGAVAHDLDGTEVPSSIFEVLHKGATTLGLMSCTLPPVEPYTDSRSRMQFLARIGSLQLLQLPIVCVYAATQFPGTICVDVRTMVFLRLDSAIVSELSKMESIWRPPWRGWEHWMLFPDKRLMGYIYSHKEFGTIYGSAENLTKMAKVK